MPNKLPKFLDNHKICIICEGNEEYEYLNRLKNLKVWNEQYDISLVNAGGNGNIPARYQDRYQNGADELVLVFCDTEKKPHEQYEDIKRKINEFHGVNNAADEVIIFGNPCTMQIISKHWTDKNLKSPAKPVNAPLIKEYTGVENYKGRADQIHEVMEHVTAENYVDMSQRVRKLDSDDSRLVSSSLDYEVFNFVFDSDVYGEFENKKFQIMVIHDTPERLPFVSLGQSEKIEKDVIYVRRGTKSEKATSEEINRIIERKIATIYSENTDMSLDQHLEQLKKLYSELPQKIRVLVRKGSQPNFAAALKVFGERIGALYGTPDEYEEKDNPNYPDEGYEAFILRMIDAKKLKIEKVLDLK